MSAQRPHYRGAWHPDYLANHEGPLRAADDGSHIETQEEADRLNATVTIPLCSVCGGDGVQAGIGFRCTFCDGAGLSDAWVGGVGCRACNDRGTTPVTGNGGDGYDRCPDCAPADDSRTSASAVRANASRTTPLRSPRSVDAS